MWRLDLATLFAADAAAAVHNNWFEFEVADVAATGHNTIGEVADAGAAAADHSAFAATATATAVRPSWPHPRLQRKMLVEEEAAEAAPSQEEAGDTAAGYWSDRPWPWFSFLFPLTLLALCV